MSSNSTGYCIGEDQMFKTTDGCKTWTQISAPSLSNLQDLIFLNDDVGVLSMRNGLSPNIFRTEDGGNTWIKLELEYLSGYVSKINLDQNNTIYMLLNDFSDNLSILKSIDQGNTWTTIFNLQSVDTYHNQFNFKVSNDKIFTSGAQDSVQIITTDGDILDQFYVGDRVTSLTTVDSLTYIIETQNTMLISENKGRTWTELYSNKGKIIDVRDGNYLLAILNKDLCIDFDISYSNHVIAYSLNKGFDWIEGDTIFSRFSFLNKSVKLSDDSFIIQTGREFIKLKEN